MTVAAAQDADAANDAASIAHAVVDASRSADEFDAVTIAGVAVTVTDGDTAGVTVSASSVTVDEGGSATYTVVLNLQPTSDVVINVTKKRQPRGDAGHRHGDVWQPDHPDLHHEQLEPRRRR